MDPEDDIRGINPLGKIPALDTGDTVIFDSRVILEYLDSQAGGGKILPAGGDDRYAVLTMAALADALWMRPFLWCLKAACGQLKCGSRALLPIGGTRSFAVCSLA